MNGRTSGTVERGKGSYTFGKRKDFTAQSTIYPQIDARCLLKPLHNKGENGVADQFADNNAVHAFDNDEGAITMLWTAD